MKRTINEIIKSQGHKVSEFVPRVLGMNYHAYLITEKKGSLRVRDLVKLSEALQVPFDILLQDHIQGKNIPLSDGEPIKKAHQEKPNELKNEKIKKYSRFLRS